MKPGLCEECGRYVCECIDEEAEEEEWPQKNPLYPKAHQPEGDG